MRGMLVLFFLLTHAWLRGMIRARGSSPARGHARAAPATVPAW